MSYKATRQAVLLGLAVVAPAPRPTVRSTTVAAWPPTIVPGPAAVVAGRRRAVAAAIVPRRRSAVVARSWTVVLDALHDHRRVVRCRCGLRLRGRQQHANRQRGSRQESMKSNTHLRSLRHEAAVQPGKVALMRHGEA